MILKRLVSNCLLLLAMLATRASSADQVALTYAGGSPQSFPGYTVGWTFTVNTPVVVTSLGWFGNAFTDAHEVGIYTSNGTLLTSATVAPGDTLTAGARYHPITATPLAPGNYVIGGTSGTGGAFQAYCSSVATDPSIAFGAGRFKYTNNDVLAFPTTASDRGIAYFGPNMLLATPEPGCAAILVPGLLALAARRGSRSRS